MAKKKIDLVNQPPHYTAHPSGIECRHIARHLSFDIGSAFKYLWRADIKGKVLEDLQKAENYIIDEMNLDDLRSMRLNDVLSINMTRLLKHEPDQIKKKIYKSLYAYSRYKSREDIATALELVRGLIEKTNGNKPKKQRKNDVST